MDNNIRKAFDETLNKELIHVVISNSTQKNLVDRIKIRPVLIKGELIYQVSEYKKDKVFHSNYEKDSLLDKLPSWFDGLFKQAEIKTKVGQVLILISKKGKSTIKYKKLEPGLMKDKNGDINQQSLNMDEELLHNKKKNYILEEGIALPFLIDLGVMTNEGQIIKAKSDKFRQINRFLEYIDDILPYLDKTKELTILDFGCGKSYLTFAMYYFLNIKKGYQINVIGLDLKSDVIANCSKLSEKYGYKKLHFLVGDIASYNGSQSVDMVVTLHACDTATDHALYKAVSWGASIILSVPCCQHELNGQIHNEILKPILRHGIIKERMSALLTDALRAEILESKGYRVQLLEFIDMEHTPKNILIRAVKRNNSDIKTDKEDNLMECMNFLGVSPCLDRLFSEEKIGEGK